MAASPPPAGYVNATLDLTNGTNTQGTFFPEAGLSPEAVAIDNETGTAYVASSNSQVAVVNESTLSVTDWISLGVTLPGGAYNGVGMAIDPLSDQLFVADSNTGEVSVINTTSNTYSSTLLSGFDPDAVVFDSAANRMFVLFSGSDNVSVINATTDSVVGSFDTGVAPVSGAYDPANGDLYVSEWGQDQVAVYNASTFALVGSAGTGIDPDGVAFDPSNGDMYVANWGSNNVTVLDAQSLTFVANVPVGGAPLAAQYVPATGTVYVTDTGSAWTSDYYLGHVTEVNTTSNRAGLNLTPGVGPWGEAVDTTRNLLFVTNVGNVNEGISSNVTVFNFALNRTVGSICLGVLPTAIAYDPAANAYIVTNGASDNISVVSALTNSILRSIPVGLYADGVAYDTSSGNIYVANAGSNNLTVLNGSTFALQPPILVGGFPQAVSYVPQTGDVYVMNRNSNDVTVVDGSNDNVAAVIDTGRGPDAMAYVPSTGDLYFTNALGYGVTVANATNNTAFGYFSFGTAPEGIAYDSDTGQLVVAYHDNFQVYIVDPATEGIVQNLTVSSPDSVTFDPANGDFYVPDQYGNISVFEGWNDSLLGTLTPGVNPGAVAVGPEGTQLYVPNEYSGSVTVIKAPEVERFQLNVSESGLPPGTAWNLSLDGVSWISSAGQISLSLPNGSYSYDVDSIGYLATPASGTILIDGAQAELIVSFARPTYSVEFLEYGLPSGLEWSVNLGGIGDSLVTNGGTDVLTFGPVPNGTYAYTIGGTPGWHQGTLPYSGSQAVAGSDIEVSMTYYQVNYTVSLTESGLPIGKVWSVTFNGTTQNVTTTGKVAVLDFGHQPNGTYSYSISGLTGWHQQSIPYTGSATVDGLPLDLQVTYTRVLYALSFSETGLIPGTQWSVTVNGTLSSVMGPSFDIEEANGTYQFDVTNVTGFEISDPTGVVTIAGMDESETIFFEDAGPMIESFAYSPNPVREHSLLTISVSVRGGAGILSYNFGGLPPGCPGANASSVACSPNEAGVYNITVVVEDQLGVKARANASLEVLPASGQTHNGTGGPHGWGLSASDLVLAVTALTVMAALFAVVFIFFIRKKLSSVESTKRETPKGKR